MGVDAGRSPGHVMGLKGIAKLAGVSTATVSRVINDRPGVRPELRRAVEEAIREHGLHVDAAARALKSRKTWKIALIAPGRGSLVFANQFFSEIFRGVTSVTEDAGYSLILMTGADSQTLEEVNRNRSCDAVLLIGFRKGIPESRSLLGATVPVITIPRPGPRYRLPFVSVDDEEGAYGVVRHLLDKGHTRIALLSGPPTNIFSINRLAGYRRALRDAQLRFEPALVASGGYTQEGAARAALQLLDLERPPTAIFATSDHMAVGVLALAKSRGLRVPEDLALVAFGNTPVSIHVSPALTTVDEQLYEVGAQAASLAIRLAQGLDVPLAQVVLPTQLIVRESS